MRVRGLSRGVCVWGGGHRIVICPSFFQNCHGASHPLPSLEPPQDVRAKYLSGPLLGKGSFGFVLGCTDRSTNVRYACKSIDAVGLLRDGHHVVSRLRNEIGVMSYLAGHPNIVGRQARGPSLGGGPVTGAGRE